MATGGTVEETDGSTVNTQELYDSLVTDIKRNVTTSSTKRVRVQEAAVHDFIKKARYEVLNIQRKTRRKERNKVATKATYFKNTYKGLGEPVRFSYEETVEDSAAVSFSKTKGFSVGVAAGVSPGSPAGSAFLGGGGSYSRSESLQTSDTHTHSKRLLAEITLKPNEQATVITELHCTEYDAKCDLDISVPDCNHKFFYKLVDPSEDKESPARISERIKKKVASFVKSGWECIEATAVLSETPGNTKCTEEMVKSPYIHFRREGCDCQYTEYEYALRVEKTVDHGSKDDQFSLNELVDTSIDTTPRKPQQPIYPKQLPLSPGPGSSYV